MAAITSATGTEAFTEMLLGMADDTGREVGIFEAESAGWMTREGTLEIRDEETGRRYLVTVQEVVD